MKYHIKDLAGDIIASFVNETDRDYSFDALFEMFPEELVKFND